MKKYLKIFFLIWTMISVMAVPTYAATFFPEQYTSVTIDSDLLPASEEVFSSPLQSFRLLMKMERLGFWEMHI